MAGARMLYSGNSPQEEDFAHFDARSKYPQQNRLHAYVETPQALSRRDTFIAANDMSSPTSARERLQQDNRRWTQADQSRVDSEKKKKAMKELVTSWQDRLQLISIITTFFAGMEAQLLGIVTPDPEDLTHLRRITQVSLVALSSALFVHTFAAILSFIAAFFLVRFRVHEAQHEEVKAELGVDSRKPTSQCASAAVNKDGDGTATSDYVLANGGGGIYSTNPHLEQVGPFRAHEPPILLLDHCHLLCMFLSMMGFVLAVLGIMCYVWARLPVSSRIVTSTIAGFCIALGVAAISVPKSFNRAVQSPCVARHDSPKFAGEDDKLPGPRG
ncbi:hypothetical protein BC835DRAFT_94807 [Cytidiella melzeri]|nr:hypothetical protein BC835DRAFT_94807 [Cytidiella melzeri]